ncbi:MAG TPA: hypothetical protein VK116_04330 [Planctomycetota bacterium]|nr:hypothetical protein [Planctomycetota bacterium]
MTSVLPIVALACLALFVASSCRSRIPDVEWEPGAAPRRIHIAYPKNETHTPLMAVAFGRALNVLVHGPRIVDIQRLFLENLGTALREKGYDITFGRPVEADANGAADVPDDADAILRPTFVAWRHQRSDVDLITTTIRLDLERHGDAPGERLFTIEDDFIFRDEIRGTEGAFAERGLLGAARSLVRPLPDLADGG